MSEPVDAGGMAELIAKLGLVDEFSVRECLFEIEDNKAPADTLVQLMQRRGLLTPLQGSKLLKGDTAGYFLGGYRVLYKISSGTFGRVYRGDDPRSGQIVAIKVLRNKWTENKQKVDLFLREGRVGMTLQHPNIVQILNVNQDQKTGQYFIVMEFVEGDNLRNIISIRGKLELDEALRMMEECAAGLAYAWTPRADPPRHQADEHPRLHRQDDQAGGLRAGRDDHRRRHRADGGRPDDGQGRGRGGGPHPRLRRAGEGDQRHRRGTCGATSTSSATCCTR